MELPVITSCVHSVLFCVNFVVNVRPDENLVSSFETKMNISFKEQQEREQEKKKEQEQEDCRAEKKRDIGMLGSGTEAKEERKYGVLYYKGIDAGVSIWVDFLPFELSSFSLL